MRERAPSPNFFIIGAAKSGTTALYHYLGQHPDVYMCPKKEPNYFNGDAGDNSYFEPLHPLWKTWREPTETWEAYLDLFSGARGAKVLGEATPWYLYEKSVPERIGKRVPDARLIAVLRHPVDRAYSNFIQCLQDGKEPLGEFAEAFAAADQRRAENWHPFWRYRDVGFYSAQLKRYLSIFGPEQVRVYLYEDLGADAVAMSRDVFEFLGLDRGFAPDVSIRYKASGVPKSRGVQLLLSRPHPLRRLGRKLLPPAARRRLFVELQRANLWKAPPLASGLRRELVEAYREDIGELQELIGRDLRHWLE